SLRSSASIRGLCRFVIANSAPPGTDGPSFSYRNGAGRLSEKNESALRRSPIVPKSGPRAPLSRTNGPRRSYRECTPGFPVYGGRGEDLRRRTVCYPLLPVEADELARTFEDLRPNLQRKLSALLGNAADAEDALQTAFLRCWQARAAAGPKHNLRGWLWRVSLNVGRDLRKYLRVRRALPLQAAGETACRREAPDDASLRRERDDRLQAALAQLRPAEREVFLMRSAGLSYRE